MICRCKELDTLWDQEAKIYADMHLKKVEVRAHGWEIIYECPDSGERWLEDYPYSEAQGGGPMRLRRLPVQD